MYYNTFRCHTTTLVSSETIAKSANSLSRPLHHLKQKCFHWVGILLLGAGHVELHTSRELELKTSHAVRLTTLLSLSWGTNWCQTSCCPFGTPTRDLTMRFSTKVDNRRALGIHYVCSENNKNKS